MKKTINVKGRTYIDEHTLGENQDKEQRNWGCEPAADGDSAPKQPGPPCCRGSHLLPLSRIVELGEQEGSCRYRIRSVHSRAGAPLPCENLWGQIGDNHLCHKSLREPCSWGHPSPSFTNSQHVLWYFRPDARWGQRLLEVFRVWPLDSAVGSLSQQRLFHIFRPISGTSAYRVFFKSPQDRRTTWLCCKIPSSYSNLEIANVPLKNLSDFFFIYYFLNLFSVEDMKGILWIMVMLIWGCLCWCRHCAHRSRAYIPKSSVQTRNSQPEVDNMAVFEQGAYMTTAIKLRTLMGLTKFTGYYEVIVDQT